MILPCAMRLAKSTGLEMKVFLDANVVLDVLLDRAGFCSASELVLSHLADSGDEGALSALSVCNMVYVMRRYMPQAEAEEKVGQLLDLIGIVDTTGLSVRRCLCAGHRDFEDSVQVENAIAWRADIIVSRDKNGFVDSPVPVLSPEDFMRSLSA